MSAEADQRGDGRRPSVELERVTKRFGGLTAVREVSLQVQPGDLLGIIGPNGAGKTTLFNAISGLARPNRGKASFAGHDLVGMPIHRRARIGIGRAFQRHWLRFAHTPQY